MNSYKSTQPLEYISESGACKRCHGTTNYLAHEEGCEFCGGSECGDSDYYYYICDTCVRKQPDYFILPVEEGSDES